jgi:hypothetical protein
MCGLVGPLLESRLEDKSDSEIKTNSQLVISLILRRLLWV